MDLELAGRTAVVTGCSVGIGREIARVLAAEGVATLIVPLLKTLQDEIETAGSTRPPWPSISPIARRRRACTRRRRRGSATSTSSSTMPAARGRLPSTRLISCGTNHSRSTSPRSAGSRELLPGMIERRWGRIVNITGSSEPAGTNAANPAKAAVRAWAKGLSRDVFISCPVDIEPSELREGMTLKLRWTDAADRFGEYNLPVFGPASVRG